MEIEYFCKPDEADRWHEHWLEERLSWFKRLGCGRRTCASAPIARKSSLTTRRRPTTSSTTTPRWAGRSSRASPTAPISDLKAHAQHSGKSLSYFDEETNEHIVPYVIEPALGVDRTFLALLYDAYVEEEVRGEQRVVLRLHPTIAPVKVALLPLSRNEKLSPLAREVHARLRPHFMTQFDDAQSIGRRYRRQDEIGTPCCVTIDFESLDDHAVTIRERDSMAQTRVSIEELVEALRQKLGSGV